MKELICFIAGLSIGSVATYILVKDKLQREMDSEVDEVRMAYEAKIDEITLKLEASERTDYEDLGNPPEIKGTELHGSTATKPDEADQATDYNKIIEDLNYGRGFEEKKEEKNDIPIIVKESPIRVISEDEFMGDEGYVKEIISYFEDGETFCDTEDEILEGFEKNIGGMDLVRNDDIYESDMIFVRNDLNHTDYQICRHEESYDEYMEGSY